MSMKLIIDGYNVLHALDPYKILLEKSLESARDQLIHDAMVYKASKEVDILLIFDGAPDVLVPRQEMNIGGVHVLFSRAPMNADSLIIEKIKKDKRKSGIIIVTHDHSIKSYAKSAGCHCLSPQEFYQRIISLHHAEQLKNKFDPPMTAEELADWKKIFGIED